MDNYVSSEYLNGFLDGAVRMTLASCRNDSVYEMSAIALDREKENMVKDLSEELGCETQDLELVHSEKSFSEICKERFGSDRKSRRAFAGLEKMLVSKFGRTEDLCKFKNDRDIRDAYSGYSGGNAPYYIVTQLLIMIFEKAAVMFIIGSDE